jgi:hypothetical protein
LRTPGRRSRLPPPRPRRARRGRSRSRSPSAGDAVRVAELVEAQAPFDLCGHDRAGARILGDLGGGLLELAQARDRHAALAAADEERPDVEHREDQHQHVGVESDERPERQAAAHDADAAGEQDRHDAQLPEVPEHRIDERLALRGLDLRAAALGGEPTERAVLGPLAPVRLHDADPGEGRLEGAVHLRDPLLHVVEAPVQDRSHPDEQEDQHRQRSDRVQRQQRIEADHHRNAEHDDEEPPPGTGRSPSR